MLVKKLTTSAFLGFTLQDYTCAFSVQRGLILSLEEQMALIYLFLIFFFILKG